MTELYQELMGLLQKGGFVAPPLVLGAMVLWWALGYRFVLLFAGDRRSARALVEAARQGRLSRPRGVVAAAAAEAANAARGGAGRLRSALDEILFGYSERSGQYRNLASGIVKIAPLLGLLGTVSGMIDTFDALGDTAGSDQGLSVAGGISEALFSTQMGLLVAIPGLLFGRLLERRQRVVEDELEKIGEAVMAFEREGLA